MKTKELPEIDFPKLNLPWVDSPFFDSLLQSANLDEDSKKLVKHYADKGYVIIDPEITNFDTISHNLIQELDSDYLGKGRIQDAWLFNENVRTVAIAPKVLSLLRLLYQREPIPFQTLNFRVGTQQKTHSDTIHFHSMPAGFMCGVWIALEDIDAYNGPLHYYPGSQKLPIFDCNCLGLQPTYSNYHLYENFIETLTQHLNLKRVEVSLKKGQALIWSANLLHGGSPILDPTRTRHSQVTHFFFSDCTYYAPLFSDIPNGKIRRRQVMDITTKKLLKNTINGRKVVSKDLSTLLVRSRETIRLAHPEIARQFYYLDNLVKQKMSGQ